MNKVDIEDAIDNEFKRVKIQNHPFSLPGLTNFALANILYEVREFRQEQA